MPSTSAGDMDCTLDIINPDSPFCPTETLKHIPVQPAESGAHIRSSTPAFETSGLAVAVAVWLLLDSAAAATPLGGFLGEGNTCSGTPAGLHHSVACRHRQGRFHICSNASAPVFSASCSFQG